MHEPLSLRDRLLRGPGAGWAWLAHRGLTGRRAWVRLVVEAMPASRRAPLLERLERVAKDPLIAGVLLELRGSPGGWSAVQDWRATLHRLRASRRWVEAYLEDPTEGSLLVAAAADRVTVPSGSAVVTTGVGTVTTHQQAALDKLGLSVEVVTAGAFKSAGEPWARRFSSPPAREALGSLLADLDDQALSALADDRGVSPSSVQAWRSQGWMTPREACQVGMIDAVGGPEDVVTSMRERIGAHAQPVRFETWALRDAGLSRLDHAGVSPQVAVVHLQGAIQSEEGGSGHRIRMRSTLEAIEALGEAEDVVAVVLHVDSPGGGVLPSQRIGDAVARLNRRKPVVASYADVSASGGVMISAPCARILARAGTITGSIGVVAGKLVARNALRKVGVAPEAVGGSPFLAAFSPMRAFSEVERQRMAHTLEAIYGDFVARVAAGRGRSVAEVEPWCRGRVWTGRQAFDAGLIDGLGGVDEAVDEALGLLGYPEEASRPRRVHLDPCQRSPWEALRHATDNAQGKVEVWRQAEAWVGEGLGPMASAILHGPGRPLAVWPWGRVPGVP